MKKQITTIMFLLAFSFSNKIMSAAAGMVAHRQEILPVIAATNWIDAVGGRQNCQPAYTDDALVRPPDHLLVARIRRNRAYVSALYLDTLLELRRTSEALQKSQSDRLQLIQQMTALQAQLQAERAAAQGALHTYDAERRTLIARIQSTEAEIAQLKADITQLRSDIEGARGDRDGARKDLIETRMERDSFRKERDDLQAILATRNEELELIKRSISIHEDIKLGLERTISALETEVATKKATITGIVSRMRYAIGEPTLHAQDAAWLFTGNRAGALPLE